MMKRALLLAVLLAGSCAYPPRLEGPDADTRISVVVENDSWEDVTVYVERTGVRERIGRVGAVRQDTFAVPLGMLEGRTSFVLEPLGTRGTQVYGHLDDLPAYGSFRYRLTDVPLPIHISELRVRVAPRIAFSTVAYWR